MDESLTFSLFVSNIVIFLHLVLSYEVLPLLIQYGSLSIACFRAFVIEESFEVGSRGVVVDKLGEGMASPGGVVEKSGNGSVSLGVVEEE